MWRSVNATTMAHGMWWTRQRHFSSTTMGSLTLYLRNVNNLRRRRRRRRRQLLRRCSSVVAIDHDQHTQHTNVSSMVQSTVRRTGESSINGPRRVVVLSVHGGSLSPLQNRTHGGPIVGTDQCDPDRPNGALHTTDWVLCWHAPLIPIPPAHM